MPAGKLAGYVAGQGDAGTDHRERLVGVDAEDFVISVRSDVAHPRHGVGRNLLFHPERPGNERGRLQIRLHSTRHQLSGGWNGQNREFGYGEIRKAIGWVEGRVLIGAITERVLQIVVHAEAGANHSLFGVAERAPGDRGAGLREELCVVRGESRRTDMRLSIDDAIGEGIGGRAAIHLIPAVGEFRAEAERKGQLRRQADDVFGVRSGIQRSPAQRCRRRIEQQRADGALQECLQAGERRLAVLAERQCLIGLQALEPCAECELMAAVRKRQLVFVGKNIARYPQIASVVASRQADLRGGIGRRAAAHYQGANGIPRQETRQIRGRRSGRRFTGEEIAGARITDPGRIDQRGREDVSLLQAGHLLAQGLRHRCCKRWCWWA